MLSVLYSCGCLRWCTIWTGCSACCFILQLATVKHTSCRDDCVSPFQKFSSPQLTSLSHRQDFCISSHLNVWAIWLHRLLLKPSSLPWAACSHACAQPMLACFRCRCAGTSMVVSASSWSYNICISWSKTQQSATVCFLFPVMSDDRWMSQR